MAHLIPENEIERLSSLCGVSFEEYKLVIDQLAQLNPTMLEPIYDSVETAWQICFPVWREFGRVQDLSHCIRTPHYYPSYAQYLGEQFVEVHREDFAYLLNLLTTMPINSYEYLCAYDLLEMTAGEFCRINQPVPEAIYEADRPVPPVIYREKAWDKSFHGLESIGRFIRQSCLISDGDDMQASR
jgi:hypothetical protein